MKPVGNGCFNALAVCVKVDVNSFGFCYIFSLVFIRNRRGRFFYIVIFFFAAGRKTGDKRYAQNKRHNRLKHFLFVHGLFTSFHKIKKFSAGIYSPVKACFIDCALKAQQNRCNKEYYYCRTYKRTARKQLAEPSDKFKIANKHNTYRSTEENNRALKNRLARRFRRQRHCLRFFFALSEFLLKTAC